MGSLSSARRRLLGRAAALGAAAATAPALPAAVAAEEAATGAPPRRIDIHHHLLPPVHIEAVAAQRTGERAPAWSTGQSLEEMDRGGIATAVVSLTQPGVWLGDAAAARRLARASNEYAARMAADHPGRFGSFAAVPLPDTEGSLREIEHALDVLKAEGIGLMTSYGERWLGDRSFWPVLAELDRREAVVYTHPLGPACCRGLSYDTPVPAIEYATDTTRTMASILFSGAAARFPRIRWIFSHGGGTTPFLLSRFERVEAGLRDRAAVVPRGYLHELKKFHYDTAQANHPAALAALATLVEPSQLLYGTDYPFRPAAEVTAGLAAGRFDPAALRAIERGNALRLMPRLGA